MRENPIKRVAIVGGTHGNELTGAYLVKKLERAAIAIQRSSFETIAFLANPKAFAARTRYIDRDLNRCFSRQDLADATLLSYEDIQAKTIDRAIGPKGNAKVDAIVDLHSTTANMGMTLILSSDRPVNLRLAAYLVSIYPDVKAYYWSQLGQESPFLRSLCELGCTLEVGPIAPGILDAKLFQQTEQLIFAILDYFEAENRGQTLPMSPTLTLYRCIEVVDFPRTQEGELQAMIHPQLQFKDYEPLHPGDPMFLTFDGDAIAYQGQSTVYPVFINEAAYYEKGIAMCLTEKQQIDLETLWEYSEPK